jgi:hypothetical protein
MNNIIRNTGLWAAIVCLASFVVWIVSFIGIAVQSPLFYWTNMDDYLRHVHTHNQFLPYLAKSFMIVFNFSYMILSMVLYEYTGVERKLLARIGVVFSILFAMGSAVHYFAQISSVRFALAANEYAGLEQFLQANPASFLSSVNMLSWTFLLGLSSLFLYLGFLPNTTTKGIRLGLLINAVACISGGIGYLFQINILTFVSVNLGVGFAFFLITISSIRYVTALKTDKI